VPTTGVRNALIVARTSVGRAGSAGAWPSSRGVRGLLTQSPPMGDPKHSAQLSAVSSPGFKGGASQEVLFSCREPQAWSCTRASNSLRTNASHHTTCKPPAQINVTFVGFTTEEAGPQFQALEACAKCKTYQVKR
jgi:hypothetical protein